MTNLRKCCTFHERSAKDYLDQNLDQKTALYQSSHFKFLKIPAHANPEVVMTAVPLGKERRQAAYSILEVVRKKT